MSKIEEFFEKAVAAGIIPQIPTNYDAVAYKIYTGYLENKTDELTAEVAELRERLDKAVELPYMYEAELVDYAGHFIKTIYCVLYNNGTIRAVQYSYKKVAEARLKELKEGKQ